MRSAPFFLTGKGKVCGAAIIVASLLVGLAMYRGVCAGAAGDAAVPRSVEHEEMYRSLEEQTRRLEELQQDVDAANLNLEEISEILKEEAP